LLGTAVSFNISEVRKKSQYLQLHTLEDFTAHSNFCELALMSMGYKDVFAHVGDNVRIQAPNGRWVAPIVTGMSSLSTRTTSMKDPPRHFWFQRLHVFLARR